MNMDEETKAAFAALMQRMNDGFEHVADRMSAVEKRLDALTEIARTTNTLLSTVAGLLTDFGRRITDLEKK
jgi:DNA repair ATPase RecN